MKTIWQQLLRSAFPTTERFLGVHPEKLSVRKKETEKRILTAMLFARAKSRKNPSWQKNA